MKDVFVVRQGDVGISQIDMIPANAEKVEPTKDNKVVLAYGEVTGHSHRFNADFVDEFKTETDRFFRVKQAAVLNKIDDNKYQIVQDGAILFHEEHNPIILEPGDYKIIQQQEYIQQNWRNVAD